ncbi:MULTISPECIES: acetyltransferase [Bacillus cereus group]|uniref:UDP-N-acetylbacillosamine N-acetyltransferase n=1 Tax=Bacillus thuringiensis Bt18247 TaxID=1423143 RepID=A0A9W3SZ79_BACTU|nr:acetyltransferase [Bacillus thuringiensis]MDA1871801.1 acetyltransferase [Bacillus cereus]AOM13964.1 UDP-N-acetylbacillosamine N-acetyltransferase [Bacillus thuringiensis Bt18247]MBG9528944.1 acetyltransferase [Bacillus thuringiensis]MED4441997.1 acetyltransferase [Bacillus cereus]PEB46620.1 acetyltransferase [Bacillus thuringiensis]
MKKKLLIIGAGGHGRVIADIALRMNKWEHIAFLDDNEAVKTSMGIEIIDKLASASKYIQDYDIFVGIGNNVMREKLQGQLEACEASIPVLVHPNAIVGKQVQLGAGTVVMAGVVINCCTNIGKGCIINTASTVDHDNAIGDYVHISPGAHLAGTVKCGRGTWIGIGSTISNNINISCNCTIGAGTVVIRDIESEGIYIGVPAVKMN